MKLNIKKFFKFIFNKLFSDKNYFNYCNWKLDRKLSFFDIGARGGVTHPWVNATNEQINVTLFEPDVKEFNNLKKNKLDNQKILPYALWSSELELDLNINYDPQTSSIYKSNMDLLMQFDDCYRFKNISKNKIKTKTIDALYHNNEIIDLDFIKIDIQGGEIEVLKGGKKTLESNLVGLETEVEFAQMYKDQSLFSELEIFIRKEIGLELWDIKKTYWKYSHKKYNNPTKGRLISGDALFLRPLSNLKSWLKNMDKEKAYLKLNILITTALAYGYLDYAYAILESEFTKEYLGENEIKDLLVQIKKLQKSFYPFRFGVDFVYLFFQILANSFKPTRKGWGSVSSYHLGSRKKGIFWF